jgi:hypothetical protein
MLERQENPFHVSSCCCRSWPDQIRIPWYIYYTLNIPTVNINFYANDSDKALAQLAFSKIKRALCFSKWIPACAGMTESSSGQWRTKGSKKVFQQPADFRGGFKRVASLHGAFFCAMR